MLLAFFICVTRRDGQQVISNVLSDWRRIMDYGPNSEEEACCRALILSPYLYAKGKHGSIGLIHVLQIQNFV